VRSLGDNNIKSTQLKKRIFSFFEEEVKQFPKKEISKSILTIPILTSEVTTEEVKKAMETITSEKLSKWAKENIGESIFSKRKQIFNQL